MIQEIENKYDYIPLLLIADPNINLVEDYLDNGHLIGYVENNEVISLLAYIYIDSKTIEIKNLVTKEEHRGKGAASALIKYVENIDNNFVSIMVGTANSSLDNITFYNRRGYRYTSRVENFFIDYYPEPIYENDMQATDMLYFVKHKTDIN